jgi:hypothetical protein
MGQIFSSWSFANDATVLCSRSTSERQSSCVLQRKCIKPLHRCQNLYAGKGLSDWGSVFHNLVSLPTTLLFSVCYESDLFLIEYLSPIEATIFSTGTSSVFAVSFTQNCNAGRWSVALWGCVLKLVCLPNAATSAAMGIYDNTVQFFPSKQM